MSSRPALSTGYSSTNLHAAKRAGARLRWGPSNSKFESSQCSYRLGMRAAARSDRARACKWQSHRVTRRSPARETAFQPVPSHRGQIAEETLMTWVLTSFFESAPATRFAQVQKAVRLCRYCEDMLLIVERRGKTPISQL